MKESSTVFTDNPATCLSLLETRTSETLELRPPKARIDLWMLLAVVIAGLLAGLLALLHQQAQRQAIADIHNLNLTLEARLGGSLHDLQASLQNIAMRVSDDVFSAPGTSVAVKQLSLLARRFPQVSRFDVLGPEGQFITNSDRQIDTPSADQSAFRQALRQRIDTETSLAPMELESDHGHELLYVAVPVFDDRQQPLGWIAAQEPLKAMLDFFDQVDVGAHGVITLRRSDRPEVILRAPRLQEPLHQYNPDAIDHLLDEGANEGTLTFNSRVDGVKRLYGFKRVNGFSLVLVTGLAAADYLAWWRYTVFASSIACGVLYLFILGLTLRLQNNRFHREQMVDELRKSAFHDALTGLPNRRYLRERVNQAINECGRGQRLALLYFDVDNFKTINDSLGHIAGDSVLEGLATRLQALRPAVDTVARLSGDEFLVLVGEDDPAYLAQLIEQIFHVVHQPLEVAGYHLSITLSTGVALYPNDGYDFGSLLKAADTALYQAKRNGRNTWVFYEAAMGERGLWLLQIQTELRRTHALGALDIHYQPQIDLGSGEIIGAEALLRWNHPEKGVISPGEFIPVAESSGLIIPISNWLLRKVCRQAVAWQDAGFGELTVAMNCSAVQFRQGDLVREVRQALHETGLKPSLLELELTESILIENSERVLTTVQNLKALGVRMSIDDFGTGYSSMAYLKRFAVDKLKIDQSFVRCLLDNPQDAAIVQAVITLGHSFDMKVIAEGVEDFETLDALIARGCDEAQGYYYAKALSSVDFEAYLQTRIEAEFTAQRWV